MNPAWDEHRRESFKRLHSSVKAPRLSEYYKTATARNAKIGKRSSQNQDGSKARTNSHSIVLAETKMSRYSCNSEDCLTKEATQVTRCGGYKTPEDYWDAVRKTIPPYNANGIHTTKTIRYTDAELAEKISKADGDTDRLISLIRSGGTYEDDTQHCVWCNAPIKR